MKKINNVNRINIEDWELKNFQEFICPEIKEQSTERRPTIYTRVNKLSVFIEHQEANAVLEYLDILDDDQVFIIHTDYKYFLLTEKELKEQLALQSTFDREYEKSIEYADRNNYNCYYGRIEYDFVESFETNIKRVDELNYKVDKKKEEDIAKNEGTSEMQVLANTFNELGVYKNSIITLYKDEIKIKDNEYTPIDVKILLHQNLTGLEVAQLDREFKTMGNTDENILNQLSIFLRKTNFSMRWGGQVVEHSIWGEKFKIKLKKTHNWTKNGDMHSSIIDLKHFTDSLLILEFYENSTKPVGEYYNKIKFDGMKEGHSIPATFTRKGGNIYSVKIMNGIEFETQMFITNNKKKAFEIIKNNKFTHGMNLKSMYQKMIETISKQEALANIKALTALLNI